MRPALRKCFFSVSSRASFIKMIVPMSWVLMYVTEGWTLPSSLCQDSRLSRDKGWGVICDVSLSPHVSTPCNDRSRTQNDDTKWRGCCRHLVENDMGLFVLLPAKIIPWVIFHFPNILFTSTNICFVENWKHSDAITAKTQAVLV